MPACPSAPARSHSSAIIRIAWQREPSAFTNAPSRRSHCRAEDRPRLEGATARSYDKSPCHAKACHRGCRLARGTRVSTSCSAKLQYREPGTAARAVYWTLRPWRHFNGQSTGPQSCGKIPVVRISLDQYDAVAANKPTGRLPDIVFDHGVDTSSTAV